MKVPTISGAATDRFSLSEDGLCCYDNLWVLSRKLWTVFVSQLKLGKAVCSHLKDCDNVKTDSGDDNEIKYPVPTMQGTKADNTLRLGRCSCVYVCNNDVYYPTRMNCPDLGTCDTQKNLSVAKCAKCCQEPLANVVWYAYLTHTLVFIRVFIAT